LTPEGVYIVIGHDHYGAGGGRLLGSLPLMLKQVAMSLFVKHLPKPDFSMPSKKESMAVLKEMLETGKLTPIIDRTYPLSEVVQAMLHLQEGHALGKIIVTP